MSSYATNIYRFPLALSARLIDDKQQVPFLLDIETRCFPEQMQEYQANFNALLEDDYASGMIFYRDAIPIGYISGSHTSELNSEDLLSESPFVQENQDTIFYVSSVAILDEERSVIVFDFVVHELFTLLKSMDYHYFTAHVRKSNGLSRLMRRRFGGQILKSYDNWNECDEPFDYLLFDLTENPTLPVMFDAIFSGLRLLRQKVKGHTFP